VPPHWVRLHKHRDPTQTERRHYSEILSADTIDTEAEEVAYFGLMADFSRGSSAELGRLVIEDSEAYE
jgi:hypothetical protein